MKSVEKKIHDLLKEYLTITKKLTKQNIEISNDSIVNRKKLISAFAKIKRSYEQLAKKTNQIKVSTKNVRLGELLDIFIESLGHRINMTSIISESLERPENAIDAQALKDEYTKSDDLDRSFLFQIQREFLKK